MDVSKAYDRISHELLVPKLEYYGLDELSLKLILDYISNRKQRTKTGFLHSVIGLTYPMVFHTVQSLGSFYLIYSLMIYSL